MSERPVFNMIIDCITALHVQGVRCKVIRMKKEMLDRLDVELVYMCRRFDRSGRWIQPSVNGVPIEVIG